MATLYITGACLYAARIPERFFPGKCDIWVSGSASSSFCPVCPSHTFDRSLRLPSSTRTSCSTSWWSRERSCTSTESPTSRNSASRREGAALRTALSNAPHIHPDSIWHTWRGTNHRNTHILPSRLMTKVACLVCVTPRTFSMGCYYVDGPGFLFSAPSVAPSSSAHLWNHFWDVRFILFWDFTGGVSARLNCSTAISHFCFEFWWLGFLNAVFTLIAFRWGKYRKRRAEVLSFFTSWKDGRSRIVKMLRNVEVWGKKIPRVNKISNVWVLDLYEKMMTERINDDLVNKWKVRSELEQYKTALRVCGGDVSRWRRGGKRHKFWILLNTSPTSFIANEETTRFSVFYRSPAAKLMFLKRWVTGVHLIKVSYQR